MLFLRDSEIHGVGVFTDLTVRNGDLLLDLFHPDDYRFIPLKDQEPLCDRYGIWDEEAQGYHCPAVWHRMSLGWFLNHSDNPNLDHDENWDYYAVKDIDPGEELTVDYNTLD